MSITLSDRELLSWFPRLKGIFPDGVDTSYIGDRRSRYETWIVFNLIEILQPAEAYRLGFDLDIMNRRFSVSTLRSLSLGKGAVAEGESLRDAIESIFPSAVLRFTDGSPLSLYYRSFVPHRFQDHLGGIRPTIFLVNGEPKAEFYPHGEFLSEDSGTKHMKLAEVKFGDHVYMITDEVRRRDSPLITYGLHAGDKDFPVETIIESKESVSAFTGQRGASLQEHLLVTCKKRVLITLVQPPALIPTGYTVILDRSLGRDKSVIQDRLRTILFH
jgi:hypothetical protein